MSNINDETIKEFIEMFPDCPDPEHYPKIVAYLYKLYLFEKQKDQLQVPS